MPTDPRRCEATNEKTGEPCRLWKAKEYSEHYCIHHLDQDGPDGAAIQRELYNKKNKSLKVSRKKNQAKRKADRVSSKKSDAPRKNPFDEAVSGIFRPRNFNLSDEYEICKITQPAGTGEKDTELWCFVLWTMADDVTREPKSKTQVADILGVSYNTVRVWEHGSRFKRMSTRVLQDCAQHGRVRQRYVMGVVQGMFNGDNKMFELYRKDFVDREDGNEDPARPFDVPDGLSEEADRLAGNAGNMRRDPSMKKKRDAIVDGILVAGDFGDDEQTN